MTFRAYAAFIILPAVYYDTQVIHLKLIRMKYTSLEKCDPDF